MNIFKSAPLPFQGQKRQFLKLFTAELEKIPDDGEGWIIVDVFGGSGLLAHTAKQLKPAAKVIFNDFDNYVERLQNIPTTNKLWAELVELVKGIKHYAPLSAEMRETIVDLLHAHKERGYFDLHTIKSWLLYSGRDSSSFENLLTHNYYHNVPKNPYAIPVGYLEGVELVSECCTSLLPTVAGGKNTLLVLDPPYIQTSQSGYKKDNYFGMCEFLELIELIEPPFIIFGSERSELMRFVQFVSTHRDTHVRWWGKFSGYEVQPLITSCNKYAKYKDYMLSTL